MRTLLKGLISLASGIGCAIVVEVGGAAVLFGGLGVRPYYWTQLQIWGMVVVASLAGFVGASASIMTARRIHFEGERWLALFFYIFPGIRAWEYYAVGESSLMVVFAAVLGAAAVLSAIPLAERIASLRAGSREGGRLTSA